VGCEGQGVEVGAGLAGMGHLELRVHGGHRLEGPHLHGGRCREGEAGVVAAVGAHVKHT
jgi:hypothetical protein